MKWDDRWLDAQMAASHRITGGDRQLTDEPEDKPEKDQPEAGGDTGEQRRPSGEDAESAVRRPLTIVGVGASAGGLEAFSRLLEQLPADTGLALVFVQHLAAHHESALPHLLRGATRMPIQQAEDGMALEPNHVYVIPPGMQLEIDDGRLRLAPRPEDGGIFMPVDIFYHSLANYAERAIGVILSGTASDGADGLREIKARGGITLAQEPDDAKYDGMPRAAIATGAVDRVLPVAELAAELVRLSRHPFLAVRKPRRGGEEIEFAEDEMRQVFDQLRKVAGVDFTHYKPGTIQRRLQRRMLLHKLEDVQGYLKFAQEHPEEIEALYKDVLIHVTRFFREPESFEALKDHVFPHIRERDPESIRIWVPGCSTGEEAYSVAILLVEALGEAVNKIGIQIFGTDVSEDAIEQARRGVFPDSVANDVGKERLRRYFSKTDGTYRIGKNVRDLCVFARQDITRDPPFSNIDLVMCRNVLIYLGSTLQKKVLGIFHYALRQDGYLMLGSAESVGAQSELFEPVDKRQRIYSKRPVHTPPVSFPLEYGQNRQAGERPRRRRAEASPYANAEQLLLDVYAPVTVLVDENLKIVQTRGKTGHFLELAAGDPDLNVLKMARPGLLHGLRSTLHAARRDEKPVRKEGLRISFNGHGEVVDLVVYPLTVQNAQHYLIAFEDASRRQPDPATVPAQEAEDIEASSDRHCAERVRALQEELETNRDYLQSTIQDLETANEELQSANEEILSSNEELQSTNEELDTAKEELQSTNEELNTVNDELQGRNEELSLANSDLVNLLSSVDIAIVMFSLDLRIRRFTPKAEEVLNLIKGDIDRPIDQIRTNIECPDLSEMIACSIDQVEPVEREVRDVDGRWYSLRIRPYKDLQNRIDGAVLTLVDIDTTKRQAAALQEAHRYAEAILQCVTQPVLVLDGSLQVVRANAGFLEEFKVEESETVGRHISALGNGQWDIPSLRELLEKVLPERKAIDNYRVTHDFPQIGSCTMGLCARAIEDSRDGIGLILLAITEVSDAAG